MQQPIRKVLSIRTFWWLVMAGLAFNFATYACNAFMVPLLMRYHGVSLVNASVATGVIVGLTGLIGLTLGGWVADRIHQRFARGRLMFAAVSMLIATLATGYALLAGRIDVGLFVAVFSIGWLFSYNFYTCVYTAIQDVVEPRLRATAMALFLPACTCSVVAWARWWWGCSRTISPKRRCWRQGLAKWPRRSAPKGCTARCT